MRPSTRLAATAAWLLTLTACVLPEVQEQLPPPPFDTSRLGGTVDKPTWPDTTATHQTRPQIPPSERAAQPTPDAGAQRTADAKAPSHDTCLDSDACQHGGHCIDSASGVSCACEGTGYTGQHCDEDIDECAIDNGGCYAKARCENVPGSHECLCGETQVGDGVGADGCRERMTAINVYSGGWSNCALGANKRVYCWGDGTDNAFGDGKDAQRAEATELNGLDDVIMLGQGDDDHSCAVKSDKSVWCWGMNYVGQLGDGTTEPRFGPIRVSSLDQVAEVAQGGDATCALHSDGVVSCWGAAWIVGNTAQNAFQARPTRLPNLSDVIRIRVGDHYACAVVRNGSLYCWGNSRPALGTDDDQMVALPTKAPLVSEVKDVMVGWGKTCAFLRSSNIRCWGSAQLDIVIERAESGCIAIPIFVLSGTTLHAWGWVSERLAYVEFTPARLEAKSIACSAGRACQVEPDGRVYCWGAGVDGPQLVPGFAPN